MPDPHSPSVDELVTDLRRPLWEFGVLLPRNGMSTVEEQEKFVLPQFTRLADALRPLRPLIDRIESRKARRAIREVIEMFDAITSRWSWQEVAKPAAERAVYLERRRDWARKELELPVLEAAISASRGQDRAKSRRYDALADEADELGIVPTMSPEEGEVAFDKARDRRSNTPRLGSCSPTFEPDEADLLGMAYSELTRYIRTKRSPEERVDTPTSWMEAKSAASVAGSEITFRSPEPDQPAPIDPLTETLDLIHRSTHGLNLVKWLSEKPGRKAKLKDVCKHIYKSSDKTSLAKTRLLIKRTRPTLERKDTPLRILWTKNPDEIKLIDR